ncbi:hypothetical protein D3C85_1777530 [compost metagenome]
MENAAGESVGRRNRLAVEQIRKRRTYTQQAQQALRSSGTRQQANAGLREGQTQLGIVHRYPVMARQR